MSDRANIYTDGAEEYDIMVGGEVFEFVVDRLIRHSYPDEKPKDDEQYLVRLKFEDGDTMADTLCYNTKAGRWDGMSSLVTHWWELPEVR